MTQNELEKEIEAYRQKTVLFPHPQIISKSKKRKQHKKINLPKER